MGARTGLGLILAATLLCCGAAFAQADINSATEAELDGIHGVGPATTRRILQERERAAFKDWADLIARVRGIGKASAARISEQGFTVNGQPFSAPSDSTPTAAQ